MDARRILAEAKALLLIDYPDRDVPDTLARAGFAVTAHGGPKPDDYFAFDVRGAVVEERRTGVRPAHADLVFSYRPLDELEHVLDTAKAVGAKTIWFQSNGAADAAATTQAAARVSAQGLTWITEPTIVEAARSLTKR